jgi:hypothetical protein
MGVLNTTATQLERVRKTLVELYNDSDQIAGKVSKAKGDRVKISRYLYRIPLELYLGGNFHKINMDGGAMGTGTGMVNTYVTAGFISTARSYIVTDEQASTTGTPEQSNVNVMARQLAKAARQAQIDDDITLHTNGTGELTNASSATNGSTTLTFAGASDTLGINRLVQGMTVDAWDATGATKRAPSSGTAPTTITNIDYANKIVTLSQSIASLTSTDLLAFPALDVYGPSTLTSFSSTWPGGGLTNGPGLTGDSFRHGIYYANDYTSSNYYLGRLKSTISQLLPSRVDGQGNAITFDAILKGLDLIRQRRDEDAMSGLMGIYHMIQRRSLFGQGLNVNQVFMTPNVDAGKMPDLMPKNSNYSGMFSTCGVPCMLSLRQYTDRVDYVNFDLWGRAETAEGLHFKKVNGQTVFPVFDGDGQMTTQVQFHLVNEFDYVCYDPGIGMILDSLQVPA